MTHHDELACAPETSPIRIAATHDGVHVTVAVTDEGQGIAPHQLPYLFRKYAAKESVTGGLGLAIVGRHRGRNGSVVGTWAGGGILYRQ